MPGWHTELLFLSFGTKAVAGAGPPRCSPREEGRSLAMNLRVVSLVPGALGEEETAGLWFLCCK